MGSEGSVSPMRVVYLTQSPGDFSLDVPAYALAYTLREYGDACLIGIGKLPLPMMEVAEADQHGIEQVYLPVAGHALPRVSGWLPFLRRFQPTIIHLGADVPPSAARKLSRALHLPRRAQVIIEDATQLPYITFRREAVWHPMLYAGPVSSTQSNDGWRQQPAATSAGARKDAWDDLEITAKRRSATATTATAEAAFPDAAFVGLIEPAQVRDVLDFARELAPVVETHPTFHCTLLVPEKYLKQWRKELPPEHTHHLALVSDVIQWQRKAVFAAGALGSPAHPTSPRLLGLALALNRPAIVTDAWVTQTPIAQAPRVKHVPPADAAAFLTQVSALLIQHNYHLANATVPRTLSALEVAQQQRWMYYGLTLLHSEAQKGKGTR